MASISVSSIGDLWKRAGSSLRSKNSPFDGITGPKDDPGMEPMLPSLFDFARPSGPCCCACCLYEEKEEGLLVEVKSGGRVCVGDAGWTFGWWSMESGNDRLPKNLIIGILGVTEPCLRTRVANNILKKRWGKVRVWGIWIGNERKKKPWVDFDDSLLMGFGQKSDEHATNWPCRWWVFDSYMILVD